MMVRPEPRVPGSAWSSCIPIGRAGIGRRLVQHAEAEAARAGCRHFELDASLPGVPLYHHLGYREVQRCGLALPDGTTLPAIRMEKTLASTAACNEWVI